MKWYILMLNSIANINRIQDVMIIIILFYIFPDSNSLLIPHCVTLLKQCFEPLLAMWRGTLSRRQVNAASKEQQTPVSCQHNYYSNTYYYYLCNAAVWWHDVNCYNRDDARRQDESKQMTCSDVYACRRQALPPSRVEQSASIRVVRD